MKDDKHFGQSYKGQSYQSWKNDTDEMDGDNDSSLAFFVIIMYFIAVVVIGCISEKPKEGGKVPTTTSTQFP